jgi:intergrase/recombinase
MFASWLRKEQIQPEVVDLLSGKVPSPVLTRHYLLTSKDMKNDILRALEKLQQQL